MSRKDIENISPGDERGTRRERERQARLRLIRSAGVRVFARHGYDAATMEMVARQAELGKATLYYYFATKQQLFADVVEIAATELQRVGDEILASGAVGLDALADIILTYFQDHSELAVLLWPAHGGDHRELAERLGPDIAQRVMAAHQPLLDILTPYAKDLANGAALPHLVGSLLSGLAGKVQQGGGAHLAQEVALFFLLLQRACAEE